MKVVMKKTYGTLEVMMWISNLVELLEEINNCSFEF